MRKDFAIEGVQKPLGVGGLHETDDLATVQRLNGTIISIETGTGCNVVHMDLAWADILDIICHEESNALRTRRCSQGAKIRTIPDRLVDNDSDIDEEGLFTFIDVGKNRRD